MTSDRSGSAHGCDAFGHLASPFVDGELSDAEMTQVTTHLKGCPPCQQLTAEYRALDQLSMPQLPSVTDEAWSKAWEVVEKAVVADRESASEAPLGSVVRALDRFQPVWRSPWARPVLYAAAASILVAMLTVVQQAREVVPPGRDVIIWYQNLTLVACVPTRTSGP